MDPSAFAQTLGVQRCRSSLPHTAGQSLSKSRAKPSVSDTLLCSIRSQKWTLHILWQAPVSSHTRISTPLRVKSLWLRCISSMDAQCWKISPSSSAPSSPNRLLKSFKIFSCWDFLQMSTMSGTDFDVKSLREKSISSYPLPFSRAMRTSRYHEADARTAARRADLSWALDRVRTGPSGWRSCCGCAPTAAHQQLQAPRARPLLHAVNPHG